MKKITIKLLSITILIVLIGLLMVYSSSNVNASFKYNDSYYYLKRQVLFAIIGFFIMYYMSTISLSKLKNKTTIIFIFSMILLVAVLIPGIGSVRGGARSWIGFGVFSIQPAEFMKISLILLMCKYLENYDVELTKLKNFIFLLAIIFIIFGLIMLQPDFGTGLVIVLCSISLLFISGVPQKFFICLFIIGVCGIVLLIISAPYRIDRIFAFIDPWKDPLGTGFQGIQSILAVAPSGLFGLGFNKSIQKHFFLPEPQNDFIFAIICEELGLIGASFIVVLYFLIFYYAIKISIRVEDRYKSYLAIGIGLNILIQSLVNICVVIGLLPITGITLPLISYGGSSLFVTMISLGILMNISKECER